MERSHLGLVYEAEQLEPVRRRVAVKVLKAGMDTKDFIGRLADRTFITDLGRPLAGRGRAPLAGAMCALESLEPQMS